MQIVGINGFKRAGKGEAGNALFELHPGVVYTLGFADKLKVLAAKLIGPDVNINPRDAIALMDSFKQYGHIYVESDDPNEELMLNNDLTGRTLLQRLGNEARVVLGDTLWIDQVLPNPARYDEEDKSDRYDELLNPMYPDVDCIAFTDLRYPNEAERVRALGGVVWEVLRPNVESDGHDSEIPLPRHLIDWQIMNDGTLDDLRDKVAEAIRETL